VYTRFFLNQKQFLTFLSITFYLSLLNLATAQGLGEIGNLRTINAKQLVELALERNPDLERLESIIVEVQAMEKPAGSLDDPQLVYAFAPATIDGLQRQDGTTGAINQRIEIAQHFPWPGTLALRKSRARYVTSVAEFGLENRQLTLIETVKQGYADWYFVHQALDINQANQSLLQEIRRVAEGRYATGLATQQDVLQAEVRLAQLEEQLFGLERFRTNIRAQLNRMLNTEPITPLPPPDNLSNIESPPPFHLLKEQALARHPDLHRLEAELAGDQASIGLAEKKFYPDIRVMAGYNSLWDESQKQWTIGASINVPLDRDKYRAGLSAAKAKATQTRWALQDKRNELLAQVEQARSEVEESIAVIRLYRDKLIPLAEEKFTVSLADYQSGLSSFLNVITAEDEKLKAELTVRRAEADYIRRQATLERWLGTTPDITEYREIPK
jgi:cobalt-zinc-cadmium efflux system outer membrane protein